MDQSLTQEIDPSTETSPTCLELSPASYPHLRVAGGLFPLNGEISLGYLELGYWLIPTVRDRAPKTVQRCAFRGSSNLGRPVYLNAVSVLWFNGIPLWSPLSARRVPLCADYDLEALGSLP